MFDAALRGQPKYINFSKVSKPGSVVSDSGQYCLRFESPLCRRDWQKGGSYR